MIMQRRLVWQGCQVCSATDSLTKKLKKKVNKQMINVVLPEMEPGMRCKQYCCKLLILKDGLLQLVEMTEK